MTMRLSVLMTVFNGAATVEEAVGSVLGQTFSDFEFLIVDNASTDDTLQKISRLSDPRIRVIANTQNEGQTKALNRGIREAQGEFGARMDADDVSHPDRFETQINVFDSHPNLGILGSWHDEISETGKYLKTMKYPTDPLEIKCHLLSDGNLTKRCLAHPTVMFRTAVLRAAGGYNESIRFAQDYDLWTRLIGTVEMSNVGRPLLKYRSSQKSASNVHRAELSLELDQIVLANIGRLLPDSLDAERQILLDALRNRSLDSSVTLPQIDQLFNRLFDGLFLGKEMPATAVVHRELIKTYLLPRFFKNNPLQAVTALGGRLRQHPGFLLDSKLQKNVLKVLLNK